MTYPYCPLNTAPPSRRLDALRDLDTAPPTETRTGPLTAQQRGYCLEALLLDVMVAEGLDPRASYKLAGEQVDGSFVVDGRTLLLEAKWVKDPLGAAALYAFKGKVAGKLVGTVGLFLAMEGFTTDAIPALAQGKEVDVIAADGADLTAALAPAGSFTEMVRVKLRAAADSGTIFAPYSVSVDGIPQPVRARPPAAPRPPAGTPPPMRIAADTGAVLIVEGPSDEPVVSELAERVLRSKGSSVPVITHVGMGITNSVRLAASLRETYGPRTMIAIVIDADDEGAKARQRRLGESAELRGAEIPIIAIPPTLEQGWLGLSREGSRAAWAERVRSAAADLDIEELRQREPSFDRFVSALEKYAASVVSGADH